MRLLLLMGLSLIGCQNEDTSDSKPTDNTNPGTIAPTVTLTAPAEGATVCGVVQVQADVVGEGVTATFTVDGVEQGSDDSAPYSWDWDTSAVANGAHSLGVTAVSGSASAEQTISVDVQNVGGDCDDLPSVVFSSPADGAYVDGLVSLQATADDDDGVLAVRFFVDNGLLLEDTAIPFSADWDASLFSEGAHTLSVTAIDTADQEADAELSVFIDRTPPTITIDTPENTTRVDGTVTIATTAMDNIGVASVTIRVDGVVIDTLTTAPYQTTWEAVEWGEHIIEAEVTDLAGHTSNDAIVVEVDDPPVIVLTSPADGASVGVYTTVTATTSDDGGVAGVSLYVDGDWYGTDSAEPWSFVWSGCVDTPTEVNLRVEAEDIGGNTDTDEITVSVDRDLQIDLDELDMNVSPSQVFTASVSDDNNIVDVVFSIDGAVIGSDTTGISSTCELDCTCDQYAVTWDATDATPGTHLLEVVATNDAGMTATASMLVNIELDSDGDGFEGEGWGGADCDDENSAINPNAIETCNGQDDDCDGLTDGADAIDAALWFADVDGDGFGDTASPLVECGEPAGYVTVDGDCDDLLASVNPLATEDDGDGIDNDCDGDIDEYIGCNPYAPLEAGSSATKVYDTVYQGDTYTETLTIPDFNTTTGEGTIERSYAGSGFLSGDTFWEYVTCDADGYALNYWTEDLYTSVVSFSAPRIDLLPEAELVAGASWDIEYTADYDMSGIGLTGSYDIDGITTVTGLRTVTVTAGTFTALVVETQYTRTEGSSVAEHQIETWYVAGLGMIYVENTDLSDGSTLETRELRSYSGFTPR